MSDSPLERRLRRELDRLRAQDLYRHPRAVDGSHGATIEIEGARCLNFCSNDYLGLASDPRVAEAARSALARQGTGSGAAALVSGYDREHAQLEEELADFVGRPRALLFSSGWAANLGALRALLGRDDTLVADELNHASLIDGGRLSGARYLRAAHADVAAFERALAGNGGRESDGGDDEAPRTIVASDSVFSMDGDLADVPALAHLCERHGAALMIDDAHGFGVLGAGGCGAVEHFRDANHPAHFRFPEIYVATLGKSLGCAGAFVAGSEALIETLIQRARTWVFSTAMPPALAAAARCALRLVQSEPQRRAQLHANVRRFREGAARAGLRGLLANPVSTPIQPLIVGGAAHAVALSRALLERGYWVAAIRPPTVPAGTSRLRITLSAAHDFAQIDGLVAVLAETLSAASPEELLEAPAAK